MFIICICCYTLHLWFPFHNLCRHTVLSAAPWFCAPFSASPILLPKPFSVYGYKMLRALFNTKPLYYCIEQSRSSEDDSRRGVTFDSHILCVQSECLIPFFFHALFTDYILSLLNPVHFNITLPNVAVESSG